jgi:hypothetical protein
MGKEGLTYSIKPLRNAKKKEFAPGPGYYNPCDEIIQEKVKAFKIMNSGEKKIKTEDAPAPGTY